MPKEGLNRRIQGSIEIRESASIVAYFSHISPDHKSAKLLFSVHGLGLDLGLGLGTGSGYGGKYQYIYDPMSIHIDGFLLPAPQISFNLNIKEKIDMEID